MQGSERPDRELLDASALVGHLIPAGSMFGFLAGHRQELFPDEDFADLFPSVTGRPSIPGSVMASIMVLQALQPGVICGGRSPVGCRWTMRVSTPRRWCTGGGGWPRRIARSASTTRCGRWWPGPGSFPGAAGGRWIPRSWPMGGHPGHHDQLIAAIRRVGKHGDHGRRLRPRPAQRCTRCPDDHPRSRRQDHPLTWTPVVRPGGGRVVRIDAAARLGRVRRCLVTNLREDVCKVDDPRGRCSRPPRRCWPEWRRHLRRLRGP